LKKTNSSYDFFWEISAVPAGITRIISSKDANLTHFFSFSGALEINFASIFFARLLVFCPFFVGLMITKLFVVCEMAEAGAEKI
jgi:hypothetical protein